MGGGGWLGKCWGSLIKRENWNKEEPKEMTNKYR